MDAKKSLVALLLVGIILVGCAPVPVGTVLGTPSLPETDLTATASADLLSKVTPSGEIGVSPANLFYGPGCGPDQPTRFVVYVSSKLLDRLPVPPSGKIPAYYQFLISYSFVQVGDWYGISTSATKTLALPDTETIPGYRAAIVDLSTETFDDSSTKSLLEGRGLALNVHFMINALLQDILYPFSTDTETVYKTGTTVFVKPCGKSTTTLTPDLVDYSGTLTFSPDTIYKGTCSGGEPQELTVDFQPRAAISDPAVEYWAVLTYAPSSTMKPYGDMSYKMTLIGGHWKSIIKTSDWSAIAEDGVVVIGVHAQKGDPTAPTILYSFTNFEAAMPSSVSLKMCEPAASVLSVTCPADITHSSSSSSGFAVTYSFPSTTSTCSKGPAFFNCTPPSGSTFPVGTTTVECSAVDSCGNSAACKFNVAISYSPPVVATDTPVPQVAPTDTPIPFACSIIQDQQTCDSNPACFWDQGNPNLNQPPACKNK